MRYKCGMVVIFWILILSLPLVLRGYQDLATAYRTGPIVLKNVPGFGDKTDWTTQFYNTFTDIAVAPDGSIFAASNRQHTIFKFDSNGILMKSFGQEGQGPGDFNGPGEISILDNTYLVVGEYPLGHRISLFDLNGNFVKLLKTQHSTYYPTALRDGKIAYIGLAHRDEGKKNAVQIQTVYIIDINTQEETEVSSFRTMTRSIRLKSGMSLGFGGDTGGWTYLARTKDGNLAVGISTEPLITLYSPDGLKLSEFKLEREPVAVTKSIIKRYKEVQLDSLRQSGEEQMEDRIEELEKASFDHLFVDYLPLYQEFLTDEEGHFLVFRRDDCFANCPIQIEVYSPEGQFLCQTEIETEDYDIIIDRRRKHLCFTKNGLIALVQPKTTRLDFLLKLIKVAY